jgi:protein-S-isoprenylcysteine O-methyltransferase Ste14
MTTLACVWIAWCSLHSLLISRQAHHFFDRLAGRKSGIYRIAYVVFSVASLVPVLWYQFSLPQTVILPGNPAILFVQVILLLYAAVMFYLGGRMYDMHYFLGITQWLNAQKNKPETVLPFRSDGVLGHVRHPWYSGGIALLWGLGAITDVYLLTRVLLTSYFVIGTLLEEKRLKAELGEEYAAYCRKVPMLIPWKKS